MDQITVSDIPLPGEEFSFKTDSQTTETAETTEVTEITDDASNVDSKTDELKEPIVAEQPLQVVEIQPCTTKTSDNIELSNQIVDTIEASTQIETIEVEKDISESTDTELKPETTSTETIASGLLNQEQDVSEAEVGCVTSDVITETVEELQMEVERVLTEQTKTEVEQKVEEQIVEQPAELEIVPIVEQPAELEIVPIVEEPAELEIVPIVEEPAELEIVPIVEQPAELEIVPIVEEPPTPAIEREIIDGNNKTEQPSSPKPAKKVTRTNSTIEAIKNDWADSLTIEEMNEEELVGEEEEEEEEVEEAAADDDDDDDDDDALIVELKEEVTAAPVEDPKPEPEPEPEPIITEPHDNKQEVETVTTTEVLVLETVNEEIVASVAENVTIEIIDNRQPEPSVKHEEEPSQAQPPAQEVYIVEEVTAANNNTSVVDKQPKRNVGGRPSRASQRISGANSDRLQIPCHVLGRNVDNPTEDLISNGRTPPKPRLGVKVPYRFLTSQIVSKEEIADELIELTNKRNPAPDPPAGGDIFFASKLTQRLASKIALNANKQKKTVVEATSGIPTEALNNTSPCLTITNTTTTTTTMASTSQPTTAANNSNKNTIGDNSDLLAILEGDVDVDWAKEVRSTKQESKTSEAAAVVVVADVTEQQNKSSITSTLTTTTITTSVTDVVSSSREIGGRKLNPEMERQLALKQLREMPMKKEGRGRPRKHHHLYDSRSYQKQYMEGLAKMKDVLIKESSTSASAPIPTTAKKESEVVVVVVQSPPKLAVCNETNENIKQAVTKLAKKIKENENTNVTKTVEADNDLNLNPKRVTKTYSRKEAVLDVPAELDYIVNEPEPPSALPDHQPPKTEVKKSKRSAADINKPEVTLVSKRARIIKKKVIWDPAEVPKTKVLNAIRKAQALEMKARKKKQQQQKPQDEEEEEDDEETEEDKQPLQQRQLRRNKIISRPPTVLTKVQKQKLMMKRQLRSLKGKLIRSSNGEFRQKKKQQPKKTELDRLLGDEGAVNMLYSVRQKGKTSQRTIVTKKELLNRKKVIKEVITQSSNQKVTPKALRKKETPPALEIPPPRKKSRDSVRSSLQSPPPSPSYFQHHPKGAEASRIIRRHSSSFSSDCSSPRRLSVDNKVEETPVTRVLRRKTIQQQQTPSPLPPPPPPPAAPPSEPDEKTKKEDTTIITIKSSEREKLSVTEKRKLNAEMSKNFDKTPKKRTRSSKGEDEELKTPGVRFINVQTEYKEILLKKSNNFYQIIMNSPANAKLKNVISLQMFHELGSVLTKLSKDESCQVVALTSTGKSFCRGLDFSNLIQTTAEKRSTAAQEMSKALKEFIQTLAKFPKLLLACLHSSTSLLGTTMLPYFDVVLCSEAATLSADYSRVGHSPEGAPGVALCPRVGPTLAGDLLILGRRLTAKEALDCGLVARVEKPDKIEEALFKMASELGEKSHQCLTATKSLLRLPLLDKLEAALELEGKLLIEHWVNSECQQNFKKLLQEEELW